MIRTLIADDEEPARRLLRVRLEEEPDFEIVGEARDGTRALDLIQTLRPEVVFLDIRMPGLDGVEVMDRIHGDEGPLVILVTAYDRFAVQAFERRALDYLLKPVTTKRWLDVIRRVRDTLSREELVARQMELSRIVLGELSSMDGARPRAHSAGADDGSGDAYLRAKKGDRIVLLRPEEVQRVEAARNYVRLVTARGTFEKRATMATLATQLPASFTRVHRSTIVNLDFIDDIRREWHGEYVITMRDGAEVRMSRGYADSVLNR